MIGIGGLALHPFADVGVIVLVSAWKSLTFNPLYVPTVSTGLNPVCVLMSIFNESSLLAPVKTIVHCSSVGGWIVLLSIL